MRILIIHLSDIHLSIKDDNAFLKKQTEFLNSITHNCNLSDEVFLIISGDIAYSGKEGEYQLAYNLIETIRSHTRKSCNKSIHTIIIPGNHDCDFTSVSKVRDTLIKEILQNGSEAIDQEVVDQCSTVLNEYFKFEEIFNPEPIFQNKYFKKIQISLSANASVTFYCYNTALLSTIHEKVGGLYLPVELIDKSHFQEHTQIAISVFHHPRNWLVPSNARMFYTHVENTSDFAFTGHEHFPTQKVISDLQGSSFLHIEGDVLQETGEDKSGFNLVLLDLELEALKIDNCIWNGEKFVNQLDEREFISYKDKLSKFKRDNEFTVSHISWLQNAGANFIHPVKTQLVLSDLYVFPNLKISGTDTSITSEETEIISAKDLLSDLSREFQIILSGPENAGKTGICRTYISELYEAGYIPVYIEGYKLKETSIDEFTKVVKRAYISQYNNKNLEDFVQIDLDKLILFIDDFNKSKLNIKHKFNLLRAVSSHYKRLFIVGDEFLLLEEIVADNSTANDVLTSFKQYEILEFGHKLRSELVGKWNTLGRVESIEEEERLRKNDESERIINSIIGPNLIPAYPIYLLTILQTIEAGNPHDLKESSYGHYYQVLITSTLGKHVKRNDEIDKFYTYLSELAFYILTNNIYQISLEDFEVFHDSHCKKYKIKFRITEALEILTQSSLLDLFEGSVEFKYKYIYYFFAARYLSDNLSKDQIKSIVSAMCNNLHRTNYANIILFLTHHSKDTYILDEILKVAKAQFEEFEPLKLQNDISVINDFIKDAPKLILKDTSIEEHRLQLLEERDRDALKERNHKPECDLAIAGDELDMAAKMNFAFKTVEILGQILKNHYATIIGDQKVALAQEAYFIGLRSLNSFFQDFKDSSEFIENHISAALAKINNPNREQIQNLSKKIVFHLANVSTTGIIRKIATSVGSEKLQEVFNEVKKTNNYSSILLIDFAITTEFYAGFPISKLRSLTQSFSTNPMALMILRRIVRNYIYMYPLTIEKKQQICDLTGITIHDQRTMGATSSIKKK